jgi:hypothetical protein
MSINVGKLDRVARVILGLVLIGYAIVSTNVPYSYFGWLGLIPVATGFFGYCPLYSILRISTDRNTEHKI